MMKRLCSLLVVIGAASLHAQAVGGNHAARFAAAKGFLQVGVGGSYLRPDYGQGVGGMISPYVALDFKKSYVGVEIDGNFGVHTRSTARPNSLMFGLRVGRDFGDKLHLYVKPAIGYGHFSGVSTVPSPTAQNYLVYEVGGGADYRVAKHLNARAYAGYQIWPAFNGDTTSAYDHGGVLNPIMAGVGVAYHF